MYEFLLTLNLRSSDPLRGTHETPILAGDLDRADTYN